MFRIISLFICLATFLFVGVSAVASEEILLSLGDEEYTAQDFREWWKHWEEPGLEFPDTPQEFVDYLLLVEEGRRMEYGSTPEYKRKLNIFLKVRALNALKYDEVDSKIKITEKQVRDYYKDNYTPIWVLQILSYDDYDKAKAVAEELKAFNGQKGGSLVFADYTGVKAEDGGPVAYEQVSVDPVTIRKTNNELWFPVISNLQKWYVSDPLFLEGKGRYVVIRIEDIINDPGEEAFKKKQRLIEQTLEKQRAHQLTREMLEKFKKEQHVKIDEELIKKINVVDEFPEEVLNKPVIMMDGMNMTAGLLIQNIKKQMPVRGGMDDDELKNYMVNSIVSQVVTDNAALNRHYEKKPPLKAVYSFYSDNLLRKFVEAELRRGIKISEEEIRGYYDKNLSSYTLPVRDAYAIIKGDLDSLNAFSADVSKGKDFFDQASEHSLEAKIKADNSDLIRPEIRSQLADLHKDEVSRPFALDSEYAIVRLLNKEEAKIIPYAQVKSQIEKKIRNEKFVVARKNYLTELKSLLGIKINQDVWSKLKKEYVK